MDHARARPSLITVPALASLLIRLLHLDLLNTREFFNPFKILPSSIASCFHMAVNKLPKIIAPITHCGSLILFLHQSIPQSTLPGFVNPQSSWLHFCHCSGPSPPLPFPCFTLYVSLIPLPIESCIKAIRYISFIFYLQYY